VAAVGSLPSISVDPQMVQARVVVAARIERCNVVQPSWALVAEHILAVYHHT